MKELAVIVLLFLSACATSLTTPRPAEQQGPVLSFVDTHHRDTAEAFAAASAWASKNFPGGKDIVLSADKASGTIVMKGAYKWVKATDPFHTHFQEGWVTYTLTVKVSESSIEMEFLTGDAYGDTDASPAEVRRELSPFYHKLKDSLIREMGRKGGA